VIFPSNCKHQHNALLKGVTDAVRLPAIALLSSMMSYGSLVRETNLEFGYAIISTAFMWALPGQIALLELHASSATVFTAVLAVAMANARFFPMTATMVPLFSNGVKRKIWLYPLSHFITFHSWLWVVRRFPDFKEESRVWYFLGFALVCYFSGIIGTVIGFFISDLLPSRVMVGLVYLVVLSFIVMLSDIKKPQAFAAVTCGALSGILFHLLDTDWGILVAGLVGGTIAFYAERFMHLNKGK